ncbi:MAG: histidinol-phosphatase [Promethearchaeota archaeon]
MRLWDYHTHSRWCGHATGTPSQYVLAARRAGLSEVGLTPHFPMAALPEWFRHNAPPLEAFPKVMMDVETARELAAREGWTTGAGALSVKLGIELDYYGPTFPLACRLAAPYLELLDYVVGSVHVLPLPGFGGVEKSGGGVRSFDVTAVDDDADPDAFERAGPAEVHLAYWEAERELVRSGFFDVVGHADSIKASGVAVPEDQGDDVWEAVCRFVDALDGSSVVVEVNSAGLRKWSCREQSPGEAIVRELVRREVPLTLGSDAHRPADVGRDLDVVARLLRRLGPVRLAKFSRREASLVALR